jgi:hypothetical protein
MTGETRKWHGVKATDSYTAGEEERIMGLLDRVYNHYMYDCKHPFVFLGFLAATALAGIFAVIFVLGAVLPFPVFFGMGLMCLIWLFRRR